MVLAKKYCGILWQILIQIANGKSCGKFVTAENETPAAQSEADRRYMTTVRKLVKRYQVKYLTDFEESKEKSTPPLILTFKENDDEDDFVQMEYGSRNLNISVENIY